VSAQKLQEFSKAEKERNICFEKDKSTRKSSQTILNVSKVHLLCRNGF
jgi:tRNA U34 2-thiouridine synthase MnmA/TrmU